MAYLITGRAGSGKSTVCLEFKRRGLPAYDADEVPGLAGWIDLKTGLSTKVDHTQYVDYQRIGWNWDKRVLESFLRAHPTAYLCGSASNQLLFHDRFSQVFVLALAASVHRERLETRQNSDYAKDARQIQEIIQEQKALIRQSLAKGGTAIDATQSPSQVVDAILKNTHVMGAKL